VPGVVYKPWESLTLPVQVLWDPYENSLLLSSFTTSQFFHNISVLSHQVGNKSELGIPGRGNYVQNYRSVKKQFIQKTGAEALYIRSRRCRC
jgi:hypothetical protein